MFIKDIDQKVKIDYPCRWIYKVIGSNRDELRSIVSALLQDIPHDISTSRSSATGKYHCLNVEVSVESDAKRIAIYEALRENPAVRIVL